MAISDINSFDQSRFRDIIKNNKSQEESINFNILMLGDRFEDIISWATSDFEQELFSKYIALFHSKAQFKNEIAIANTSIYLSQGEIFSYVAFNVMHLRFYRTFLKLLCYNSRKIEEITRDKGSA